MALHSPKSKFYGEIVFDSPRKGVGSVVSYSNDDKEYLRSLLQKHGPGHIIIRENKLIYPSFDWVTIEDYHTTSR